MTHKKAVAGFVFFLLTVSVAFAQNTAWPGPTATANVGIGVASTAAKLQVAGGSVFISGDSGFLASGGAGLALKYSTAGAQLFGYDYSAGAPKNLILQSPGGNVAIGTTTASARLQVAGSAFIAGDSGALSSASGSGLGLKYTTAGAEVYGYNYSTMSPVSLLLQHFGGNVGIGVDAPLSAFHLSRAVASPTDYLMRLDNNAAAGNDPAMIITYTGGKSLLSLAGTNGGALATDGTLYFATGSDLNVNNFSGIRMSINTAGTVNIAAPTSGYALDVNGSIHATQVIGATYQDVAEWVPATAKMSPGTVVVVQRGAKNTVSPSAAAYATTVAGVVSEKPGLILGESSESKAMIATTGRVKVHVDASSGAIEAGDLLVTSGKPGMAMKSQPVDLGGVKIHRPGTLIGKALEALPSGEGDILVLLSLQ